MRTLDDDLDQNRSVVKVNLGFTSKTLEPQEVSLMLGLQPTYSYTKGELSPRMRVPRPWGCWAIEAMSNDVEAATRQLLNILRGKKGQIDDVAGRFSATVSVHIWWEPEGGQGGYTLPSDLLIELASLGERVDFYFASTGASGE
jgi:Domain of unknown function (DUF4279)